MKSKFFEFSKLSLGNISFWHEWNFPLTRHTHVKHYLCYRSEQHGIISTKRTWQAMPADKLVPCCVHKQPTWLWKNFIEKKKLSRRKCQQPVTLIQTRYLYSQHEPVASEEATNIYEIRRFLWFIHSSHWENFSYWKQQCTVISYKFASHLWPFSENERK